MIRHAPNLLTSLRICAGPISLLLLQYNLFELVLAVAIFAECSDFLDGFVARATGAISKVGKILDPLADSLYRTALFLGFTIQGWMPLELFAIFVTRDICVSALREVAELRIGTLAARSSGKWKAVAQGFSQIGCLAAVAFFRNDLPGNVGALVLCGFLIAAAVTLFSLVDYASHVLGAIKRSEALREGV